jgi:hypothetical protein
MKKLFVFCIVLLALSPQFAAARFTDRVRFLDRWSELNVWPVDTQPVDFAQTLDKKFAFVLGRDGGTYIYSAVGEHLGTVRTGGQPVALAVEPRGRMLHLANRNGSCTAISISLAGGMLNWSVRRKWKTAARPLDIAAAFSRKQVFVLEADNTVRVYSFAGQRLGSIPVPRGSSALKVVPRSRTLYLLSRNGTFTKQQSPF